MMKFFIFLTAALAAVYLGVVLLAYFNQRKLQYFPTHRDLEQKGGQGFVAWKDAAGVFLGYIRPVSQPQRTLLFFHGNGGEALDRSWISEIDPDEKLVIALVEYPGYGGKSGVPNEAGLYAAAEHAWEVASQTWKLPITVLGESLGSGVASYLAKQKKVDRLALMSPLPSLAEVASLHYPFLPVRLLLRDRYPTESYVREVKVPLHIVHGTMDDVVPIEMGKKVLNAFAGSEKAITELPGYGHNNLYSAVIDSPFADTFRAFVLGESPR